MPGLVAGRRTRRGRSPTIPPMDRPDHELAAARIDRLLHTEAVVWLSSVSADGLPHLVPIWFSWDGEAVLIASKPHARKVRNLRANPSVMLALGEPDDDFDVGMIEGVAELLDEPAADVLPAGHLAKYRRHLADLGLSEEEFLATYSQVIRIRPHRFLPWHGRTAPVSLEIVGGRRAPLDRRLAAAVRHVAAATRGSGTTARVPAGA
jgi:PPOX class probable F420-dependent enzyme